MSFNDSKQKSLLADLGSSKLRFPNIKRIKIDSIIEGSKELNLFFQNWVSSKIDFLSVNYLRNFDTGIKMGFYIDSISKAMKSVSKEIYLECFEIKEYDLEQIIKSASDWEKLIFRFSDIHCSRKLDFSVSAKCKMKFLSFSSCGSTAFPDRKTDWKSTPSCFKNIVEAISKSRLKDSLQEIDIRYNKTLNKDEVQAMFNDFKIPHISVVI